MGEPISEDTMRFMFERAIRYIIDGDVRNGDVRNGAISFISDSENYGLFLGPISFDLLTVSDAKEAIKLISGFPGMPADIRKYYDNPAAALVDYKKK